MRGYEKAARRGRLLTACRVAVLCRAGAHIALTSGRTRNVSWQVLFLALLWALAAYGAFTLLRKAAIVMRRRERQIRKQEEIEAVMAAYRSKGW